MFEMGAGPHPLADLYLAYLKQSQIFVGIYWQSYGWIASEESISGIEDEWRLSAGLPRLIDVKEPASAGGGVVGAAEQIRDLTGPQAVADDAAVIDSLAVTAETNQENRAARATGRQLSLEAAINLARDVLD